MLMSRSIRKLALTAHITVSGGLLGAIAGFLALSVAGLVSQDLQLVRSAYLAMGLVATLVIVPLALAALGTGVIQSLGTPWGLLRHYWVIAKLALTTFATIVLLVKMQMIGEVARFAQTAVLAPGDLHHQRLELAVHAAAGLVVLLMPMALSVYKPWGPTQFGPRKLRERSV